MFCFANVLRQVDTIKIVLQKGTSFLIWQSIKIHKFSQLNFFLRNRKSPIFHFKFLVFVNRFYSPIFPCVTPAVTTSDPTHWPVADQSTSSSLPRTLCAVRPTVCRPDTYSSAQWGLGCGGSLRETGSRSRSPSWWSDCKCSRDSVTKMLFLRY